MGLLVRGQSDDTVGSKNCGKVRRTAFATDAKDKKGAVVFFTPLFERVELTDKQVDYAIERCNQLEQWLERDKDDQDILQASRDEELVEYKESMAAATDELAGDENEVPF